MVRYLILPCEVGVKTVLPAVKAIMARRIVEQHGLNELETANLLGLSQSAVSRYKSKERGNNLSVIESSPEILALIDQMINFVIKEPENREGLLGLFCDACKMAREKGLMCPLCKEEMPIEWAENCAFCR